MINRLFWVVMMLPLDLLTLFGFSRLADRIVLWRLARSFHEIGNALHDLSEGAGQTAQSFERLGACLRQGGE